MRLDNLRPLLGGLKSILLSTGAPPDVSLQREIRYGYAVWLRHLALLDRYGTAWPQRTVVELGPGRSLGASLAVLLTGAEQCHALDVAPLAEPAGDVEALDGLVALLRAGAPLPGSDEFPHLHPRLHSLAFPTALLPECARARWLTPERVACLREALACCASASDAPLRYHVPWSIDSVPAGSADVVFSQAVLQELAHEPEGEALRETFAAMRAWLRPGGVMSHQIDFSSPFGPAWNEHWTMGDLHWRLVRGRRPRWINRAPLSTYLALCEASDFDVLGIEPVMAAPGVPRDRLAPRFRDLAPQDYEIRSAHLIARRR